MGYYLGELTVKSLQEVLGQTRTVIVPVGVVEQHGYHLPLGTDILNVDEVLRGTVNRLDAVIAPTLPYCYSGGELTGTINITPGVFSAFLYDLCLELIRTGFDHIVIFLGHGGTDNTNALVSALKMIYKKNPQLREKVIALVECWRLSPTWMSFFEGDGPKELHADKVETSLIMYWRPDLVGEVVLDAPDVVRNMMTDQDWFEKEEKAIDSPYVVAKTLQREEVKIGVMGTPETASAELGETICREMEEALVEFINVTLKKG